MTRKRDPDLLRVEEVVPSEMDVIYTSNIFVRVPPHLTLLDSVDKELTENRKPIRVGGTS